MSYSGYDNFLLINNEINTENMVVLFNKSDILTDTQYDRNIDNIRLYIDNLLHKDGIDITINNQLKDKIIFYSDDFTNYKNTNGKIIDIDLSFYASENVKKYMFLYDFMSEYYRNLAEIVKNNYAIDNKSLYSKVFNIKYRYVKVKQINNNDYILNVNNNFKDKDYYIISLKLSSDESIDNLSKLSQPNEKFEYIKIEGDGRKENFFENLANGIIKKEFLTIDTNNTDYYSLLAKSYQYKFEKNRLNYYVAKTIYFYFLSKHKTKVQEINNILLIDFPIIFENFDKIINEDTNESFLKIIQNSKQKKVEYDKKIKKKIEEKAKQIALLVKGKDKMISELQKNKDKYSFDELTKKIDDYETDFGKKIQTLNNERDELLNNRYIDREESRVNEAIKYKQKLHNINSNLENNTTKISKINKEINSDRGYLNIISIIIYISVFLLICLFVIIALSSVIGGSNINISIPISCIVISLILYIVIYNYIKLKSSIYTKTYEKPNILNKIFNSFAYEFFEQFTEDETVKATDLTLSMTQEQIDKLDPIVKEYVTNTNVGDDISKTQLEISIKNKILNDISRKVLVDIPISGSKNYSIDILNETIIDVDTDNLQPIANLTDNSTYYNTNLPEWNNIVERNLGQPELNIPIIKDLTVGKSLAFINKDNQNDYTIYTLKIPKGINNLQVIALVVGGGSFGGHIAPEITFTEDSTPNVQNMGEGGAGGAVIVQKIILMEGEYEIGVGRGGTWLNQDYLDKAIANGQAKSSYIKNKKTNKYILLAQGAEYINYGTRDNYNVQLSGGTKGLEEAVINDPFITPDAISKNIAYSTSNIANKGMESAGGRGGLIEPLPNQVGYTLVTNFGENKNTFYLSGDRYDETKNSDYNIHGHIGIRTVNMNGVAENNFSTYINSGGSGYIAAGGGAASFCQNYEDGEDVTQSFHRLGQYYYTCVSGNVNTYGRGGNGGGGDGSGLDYGKHGLLSTGSGGGGGKFRGGDGGSGLVLLKFDDDVLASKMNELMDLETKRLTNAVYDIKLTNTNIEIKNERLNLLELSNDINQGKQEIYDKYIQLGATLDQITVNDDIIEDYDRLLNSVISEKNRLTQQIEAYESEIQRYDNEIIEKGGQTELSEAQLREIHTNIELQKEQLEDLSRKIEDAKKRKEEAIVQVANEKAKYITTVATKLQAEACKKAFFVAEAAKRRELLEQQNLEKELYDKMVKEAEEAKEKAEREAAEAEALRDQALQDQADAEQNYKNAKNEYTALLASSELKEEEKGYLISLKLAIDYRIAGVDISSDSKLYDNLDDTEKRQLQRSLQYEKEKREKFVKDIIAELTTSLSNLEGKGAMGSRFYVNRISSGDLKLREHVETQEEKEAREKDELLRNYEQSTYVNEEQFANFVVTEHFNTDEELQTSIFRKSSESYIPPNDITLIDIEIFAHPQLIKPYAIDILNEITKQLKDINSPLRSSRYLRYTRGYKTSYNKDDSAIRSHAEKKWIVVDKESNLLSNETILNNNNDLINKINNNFHRINNLNIDHETYYDNVNPLLKKEHRKFNNNNNNSNLYVKMVENSNNVKVYDIRLKETIANYVITLCLLLSIYIFIAKFFTNVFILIFFVIIILIFTLLFFTEIYEIVYTKSDKNYWSKAKS